MTDYIFVEGDAVAAGSPTENEFAYSEGELLNDGGEAEFAFIQGRGIGGRSVLTGDVIHYELEEGAGTTVSNKAEGLPDGTVTARPYEWVDAPSGSGNQYALESSEPSSEDNPGGVKPNFTLEIEGSFTIDFYYRVPSDQPDLFYWWNSLSSRDVGFRSYLRSGSGHFTFPSESETGRDGNDIEAQVIDDSFSTNTSFYDHNWHHVRVVCDVDEGHVRVYVDDEYDSGTSTVSDFDGYRTDAYATPDSEELFRIMGRYDAEDGSPSGAISQFDRYRWRTGAIYPDDEDTPLP